MGSRIALLQLRVLWEEILERFPVIEVLDDAPPRTFSNFVHGFLSMRVRIPSRT
jgi:cytochrome P450